MCVAGWDLLSLSLGFSIEPCVAYPGTGRHCVWGLLVWGSSPAWPTARYALDGLQPVEDLRLLEILQPAQLRLLLLAHLVSE